MIAMLRYGCESISHARTHKHIFSGACLNVENAGAGRESSPLLCFVPVLREAVHSRVSLSGGLWRRMELRFGVQRRAAAQLSQWPSPLLFPPRTKLCVTLITLKQRTTFCSCAFYDLNCSIKVVCDLETLCHLYSLCGCKCLELNPSLLFHFSIFLIQTSWWQRSNKTP